MARKLISSDEAVEGTHQHVRPCSDCPMAKASLNGWLGGATPEEYRALAHSDHIVDCHTIRNRQCAGMAIYRRNVCKSVSPGGLKLERNTELVFATPMEFMAHHQAPLKTHHE